MQIDEVGAKLVAHFNRRGDVEGLRLFQMYAETVTKQLKDIQALTINRVEPTRGKSKMDKAPRNAEIVKVVEHHHVSEANARFAAKRVITMFRIMEHDMRAELVKDKAYLMGVAKGYRVKDDHVPLFVQIVEEGVRTL